MKILELRFSLWNLANISKIASYLGKHIKTNKLTAVKGKLEYARVLINMRISESVPDRIPIEGPHGLIMVPIEYEWRPVKCSKCKKVRHDLDQCKRVNPPAAPKSTPSAPNAPTNDTVPKPVISPMQLVKLVTLVNQEEKPVALPVVSVQKELPLLSSPGKDQSDFTPRKTKQNTTKKGNDSREKGKSPAIAIPNAEAVISNVNPFFSCTGVNA